jgi:hypothetical protein
MNSYKVYLLGGVNVKIRSIVDLETLNLIMRRSDHYMIDGNAVIYTDKIILIEKINEDE